MQHRNKSIFSSTEPSELVSEPVVNDSNVECQPKVWSDALIIEEYESDSDDEKGPTWLFDLDYLTDSMNYHPVNSENQANLNACQQEANQNAGTEEIIDAGDSDKEDESAQDCFCTAHNGLLISSTKNSSHNNNDKKRRQEKEANEEAEVLRKKFEHLVIKEGAAKPSSTNIFSTVSTPTKASSTNPLNTVSIPVPKGKPNWVFGILECLHLTWNPTQNRNYAEHILTGNPQQSFSIFWQRLSFLWQCKSRPLCPTLPQKAEYVAVASRCGQVFVDSDSKWHIDDSEVDSIFQRFVSCRESLRSVTDGTEALLIPTLFILWLDKVSTTSANLVSLGKVCTALERLKKNTAKGTNKMAVLDSCPKHNMVAYLEKTKGNAEFHEIINFLKRSSIHHALTVSPVVSTTFVEQFWTSAKSKTINNVRHITAKVAGKSVSISEASIRSKQLANVSVPLDHFPVNTLTSKVFSFMVKKGKHFSGKVTPLFASMLLQPTQDEGASSERPSEALPTPSPAPTSEVPYEPQSDSSPAQTSEVPIEHQPNPSTRPSPTNTIPASIPEPSGDNLGDQAKEIQALKAQITKLKRQAKPVIKHHKAYLQSVSLKQKFPRKSFLKKHRVHKEYVSKQGRKFAKGESSVQRDPLLDEMPEDKIDHMETENAQSEGRTREMVDEDKESDEARLSTEDEVSTIKEGVSTDFEKLSTDRPIVSTDGSKVSTDMQVEGVEDQVKGTDEHNEGTKDKNEGTEEIFEGTEELREGTEEKVESTDGQVKGTEDQTKEEIATQTSTQTPTSMIFGDDETIVLFNMTEKKFKQLESDEELARKIQEEWEPEEERNRIAEEKAANEELIRNFDDMKARIEADRLLAELLLEQEREQFKLDDRAITS
ncbi:hypothetical protein Tco_0922640 [Tanacetum coccineum]|uniref:Aminotransferase-like plant mobile domain-containing protein n=1 Tax=Tanacetum coccineum TaxID=301880 RepID=A0ABQ5D206_9ASTR